MNELNVIATNHYLKLEKLKSDYKTELKTLAVFKDNAKGEQKQLIKDRHLKRLKELQADRTRQIQNVYDSKAKEEQIVTSLDSLSNKDMIFISTILNGGNTEQIISLSERYKGNADVTEMIKASSNKMQDFEKKAIKESLNTHNNELEELENQLKNVMYRDSTEEHDIFNRITL